MPALGTLATVAFAYPSEVFGVALPGCGNGGSMAVSPLLLYRSSAVAEAKMSAAVPVLNLVSARVILA